MSSRRYIKLSSTKFILIFITFLLISGCLQSNRSNQEGYISDRLLGFLLTQSFPLGKADSPLRNETQRCSQWLKNELIISPAQRFRLDSGTNSIICVTNSHSKMLLPSLFQTLEQLNNFFIINSAVKKEIYSPDNIRSLVLKPESKINVEKMLETDETEQFSETGGVVTYNQKKNILEFTIIESDNARWVKNLRKCDSPFLYARELSKIMKQLPYLTVRASRTLSIIKEGDTRQQLDAMKSFSELVEFQSRYSYILNQDTQYASIATQGISGIYMGVFHVHPLNNQPSIEDKLGSLLRKNFVLVPTTDGVEVHYLDFTTDLSAEPEIIKWQKKAEK